MKNEPTALDYQMEMHDLQNMIKGLRLVVTNRLYALAVHNPEVPIAKDENLEHTIIKAKSLVPSNGSINYINNLQFEVAIKYIDVIEKHLVNLHPHKQLEIQF